MKTKPVFIYSAIGVAVYAALAPLHYEESADAWAQPDQMRIFPQTQHMPDEAPHWPPGTQTRLSEIATNSSASGAFTVSDLKDVFASFEAK